MLGLKIEDDLIPLRESHNHLSLQLRQQKYRSCVGPTPFRAELCPEAQSSNTCLLLFSQHHTYGCNACSSRWKQAIGRFSSWQSLLLLFWNFYYFLVNLNIFQMVRAVNHMQDMQMSIFHSPNVISFIGLALHSLQNCILKGNQNPMSKCPVLGLLHTREKNINFLTCDCNVLIGKIIQYYLNI